MARGRVAPSQPSLPLRTCQACGCKRPQAELLRLVLQEGLVVPDPRRCLPGRGAYICRSQACARRLWARRSRQRLFLGNLGEQAWSEFLMRPEISSLPAEDETS